MRTIRYSANGGFNDTHLYVKYPDFAAPVPVLAEPSNSKVANSVMMCCGEARESTHVNADNRVRLGADSRGERSSNFAGGGTSGQGLGPKAGQLWSEHSGWVARGLQAVASKLSGKGRW